MGERVRAGGRSGLIWCNNNFDRPAIDWDDFHQYDDDVSSTGDYSDCPANPNVPTPDCNYRISSSTRSIPCQRDLQDFARLWVCGITTNLLTNLPAGTTISLSWGDVGSPNSSNPTIDLFAAVDPDGGIGYLTNSAIAYDQIDPHYGPWIGRLGPGGSIQLNQNLYGSSWRGNHFIWCGVSNGTGGLRLTISDANGNALAQTTAYIQIVDIKQMYERWTVGETPGIAPTNIACLAQEDLPDGASPFQYGMPPDANTPYILLVLGWNVNRYTKDRFAECAFKRLYWQGYQGRFGMFRWPTDYGFTATLWKAMTDSHNYDNSEYTAWRSAPGLLNKLKDLNAKYPDHVYMLAHSMGNVVAGEALRLAGSNQVVNTYVATQGAVPAHAYDATSTNLIDFTHSNPSYPFAHSSYGPDTPNIYGDFLAGNSTAVGRRVNFFNPNDYALSPDAWCFDQALKPDYVPPNHYYSYAGRTNDPAPWNHFVDSPILGGAGTLVDIVASVDNHYRIMASAAESYSKALGATPGIAGMANVSLQTVWPSPDPLGNNYGAHYWHSAQFRGDYWQQQNYWRELLGDNAFKLQ